MGLQTQFFLQALKTFNTTNELPITLAKIVEVKDEGYYVDVELSHTIDNMQKYQNIPILRNKYSNYPVLKDDIVILLPFAHLLQNYLDNKEYASSDMIYTQCYFALPMCFKEDFKHKNELSFRTPQEKFLMSINDEKLTLETEQGIKFEMDLQNLKAELTKLELQTKQLEIKSSQLKLTADTPIEFGTSIATLGGILNDICTALNLAGAPVTVGSATTTPNPALAPQVTQIQTKISGAFSS